MNRHRFRAGLRKAHPARHLTLGLFVAAAMLVAPLGAVWPQDGGRGSADAGADATVITGPRRVAAVWKAYWNGLLVFELDATLNLGDARYDLAFTTRTRGVLSWFYDNSTEVEARGQLLNGAARPALYRLTGEDGDDPYEIALSFGPDGALVSEHLALPEDWLEDWPRKPVPEDMKAAPDPVAAALPAFLGDLPRQGLEPMQAFNGRTVAKSRLSCEDSPVQLAESRRTDFHGEALACDLDGEVVAGLPVWDEGKWPEVRKERKKRAEKREKRKARGKPPKEEEQRLILYLQQVPQAGLVLPVRMEIFGWGKATVYLTDLDVTPLGERAVKSAR
ncbi:hypothetical protein [Yunchengibacter salinarum]|uniref:hypothetical protein n=1 Tax=Yunchengibacter salinarum TaxID=3133399 RepID=UPI0035B6818F